MKNASAVLCALLCFSLPDASDAAAISAPKTNRCTFSINGDIVDGDAERLKQTMEPVVEEYSINRLWICLDSDGGDFREAIKIIDYMLENGGPAGLGTVVESGKKCYSACALIFLAGRRHHGDGYFTTQRLMHPKSKLGFHAPFNSSDAASDKKQLIAASFKNGVKAVQELLRHDKTIFPQSLLTTILSKDPNDFFEISTIDQIGRWDIGLYDYIEPKVTSERQLYEVCNNVDAWRGDDFVEQDINQASLDPSLDADSNPDKKTWKPVKSLSSKRSYKFGGFGSEQGDECEIKVVSDPDLDPTEVLRIFDVSFEKQFPISYALWAALPARTQLADLAKK